MLAQLPTDSFKKVFRKVCSRCTAITSVVCDALTLLLAVLDKGWSCAVLGGTEAGSISLL